MAINLDEGVEEAFGEALFAFKFEALDEGFDGVEEVGTCEARDEGDAEGFGGVVIFAGGVEVEEGEGGGRVGEGVEEVGDLFWGKPVLVVEPCENGRVFWVW